jgi:methyl coenzyme M reductase subunit C-like uncharacterized protein (methanogenesis marker protein 7)
VLLTGTTTFHHKSHRLCDIYFYGKQVFVKKNLLRLRKNGGRIAKRVSGVSDLACVSKICNLNTDDFRQILLYGNPHCLLDG